MALKLFSAAALLESATKDPADVMVIEAKKEGKNAKEYKCLYWNLRWNIGVHKKASGWFLVKDFIIPSGIADPNNKEDPRNKHGDGTRLQLQTTVSKCPHYGPALLLLNPHWIAKIQAMCDNKEMTKGKRDIHPLLQTHIAEESTNVEQRGQPIEDPIIRIKMDFKPFPEKYPIKALANKPKTQIFDYRTATTDDNGKTTYQPAEVDGQPVTDLNVHLFITRGSIVRECRVMQESVSSSAAWISAPMLATYTVVEPGSEDGFGEVIEAEGDVIIPTTNNTNNQPIETVDEETASALLDNI